MPDLLAFDTSTERLSIAVQAGERVWTHEGEGGAASSAQLIPQIQRLLVEAGLSLRGLDAIVFGRGPGSFTGLRTACSVAQGLALGAGLRVLPIDTLLAVADEARHRFGVRQVVAVLDARMDQVYAARYDFDASPFEAEAPGLLAPEAVVLPPGYAMAGNALAAYAGRLPPSQAACPVAPEATALLRLAPALLAAGGALDPQEAQPLYVRDKVAQTTDERALLKAAASQSP